ncbi:MAG: hypothetical protein ACOC8D_02755 [bacterium]
MAEQQYLKAIYLLDGRGLRPQRAAVFDALADIFAACGVRRLPAVQDFGCWRHPQYIDPRGYMVPYLSVPWYIEQAREPARQRVDAQRLVAAFRQEPWRREDSLGDHYDVLLLDQPLFDPAEEEHFGLAGTPGYAVAGVAAVLSTHGIGALDRVGYSLLKTLALRELAHAFGVPSLRQEAIELIPRVVCTHPCILGPCLELPADLERLTDLRLAGPPFCDTCLAELRAHLAGGGARAPEG